MHEGLAIRFIRAITIDMETFIGPVAVLRHPKLKFAHMPSSMSLQTILGIWTRDGFLWGHTAACWIPAFISDWTQGSRYLLNTSGNSVWKAPLKLQLSGILHLYWTWIAMYPSLCFTHFQSAVVVALHCASRWCIHLTISGRVHLSHGSLVEGKKICKDRSEIWFSPRLLFMMGLDNSGWLDSSTYN